ncbi:MAG: ribosome recycling factor [Bacilli bacterium]
MEEINLNIEEKMDKAIENMEKRFSNVRAGRASATIFEGLTIPYYGTDTPLLHVANISVPEARTIAIKPFDKNNLGAIEKVIFESNLGLTPNNNGEQIILNFPPLTEEKRIDFVKQVKVMAEETKVAIRTIRQDVNNSIKKLEISEDLKDREIDKVQEVVNLYNQKIEDKLKEKEKELLTI